MNPNQTKPMKNWSVRICFSPKPNPNQPDYTLLSCGIGIIAMSYDWSFNAAWSLSSDVDLSNLMQNPSS